MSEGTAIRLASIALVLAALALLVGVAAVYYVQHEDHDCPQAVAR
jgi:hypothetical protein